MRTLSIRVRLLLSLLAMLALAALVMGIVTYRNVLEQTEALFDYQLRQMALSLRDQGEIASSQADALADERDEQAQPQRVHRSGAPVSMK